MPSAEGPNSRYIALKICLSVIEQGRSLSQTLGEGLAQFDDKRDRAFSQNLVMGTLRYQIRLEAIRDTLLSKKLKAKDEDINQLIVLGLYQILYMETPEHAAVSETVDLTLKLKKSWAKGLVNGVLRRFLREKEAICEAVDVKPAHKYAHPQWLTKTLRKSYPDHWASILEANNAPAPLALRVNPLVQTRKAFEDLLTEAAIDFDPSPYSEQAIVLKHPQDVTQLPTYETGGFSVQDLAAQQAAYLLNPQPNERILDACAAPGGKTTHLLERCDNQADLLALEKAPERIERLSENLYRLGLDAEIEVADASTPDAWWDGNAFDKILLDAPCSATGIIRRHPDIKFHRTPQDIEALNLTQAEILTALWRCLKPGGTLLYATCSVLPSENTQQIQSFLDKTPDAKEVNITIACGLEMSQNQIDHGCQILPKPEGMDGFYYCMLQKQ